MTIITEKARSLLTVQLICLVIAWLAVVIRFWAKYKKISGKGQQTEDWIMYASFLIYTAQGVVAIYGITAGGIGKHANDLNISNITITAKMWYVCEAIYGPLSALIRTSIGLYIILRLLPRTNSARSLHYAKAAVIIGLAVMYVFTIVYCSINIFQCHPVSYYWRQFEAYQEGASCHMSRLIPYLAIAHSTVAFVSDFLIVILSVVLVWQNSMSLAKKVMVIFVLAIGIIAGIIMIIRIPYIIFLEISADFLYKIADVAMWSTIEPALGIVAGCLPVIYALFLSIFRAIKQPAEGPEAIAIEIAYGFEYNTSSKDTDQASTYGNNVTIKSNLL
ncbi:hypothetical protein V8C42DRAFT_338581 [Trichoderma barbatum]